MTSPQDLVSPEYYEIAATWVDDDAIKTSIATVAAAITYAGAGLNGAVGVAEMNPEKHISVTTASNAGSYALLPITITGTNYLDQIITDTITPTLADGNETLQTSKPFKKVTSIAIPAQNDTGGHFKFGVLDMGFRPAARWFEPGKATTGAYKLFTGRGHAVTLNLAPNTPRAIMVTRIDGTQADFPFRVYR